MELNRFNQLLESRIGDVRPLINEQLLKKLFGLSDNAISNLGKIASNLEYALSNPINLVKKNNVDYLKLASGADIPVSYIEQLVKQIESGKIKFSDVQTNLPDKLAGGESLLDLFRNIKPASKVVSDVVSSVVKPGTQISSNFFDPAKINWNNVTNAKDMETYNKFIANAISSGNYSQISSKGFEQYGIDDFREFLKNRQQLDKRVYSDPKTGDWYFTVSDKKLRNILLGKRMSNNTLLSDPNMIDFSKMSNIKDIDTLNKQIASAIETGRYDYIPRGGFEEFGINATDYNNEGFRGFIKDQFFNKGAKLNDIDSKSGRWSITFK